MGIWVANFFFPEDYLVISLTSPRKNLLRAWRKGNIFGDNGYKVFKTDEKHPSTHLENIIYPKEVKEKEIYAQLDSTGTIEYQRQKGDLKISQKERTGL